MTQEQKELLLKDLYGRLPYGVKILHEGWNYEWDQELSTLEKVTGIDERFIYTKLINDNGEEYTSGRHTISLLDDKPFLFPLSSMTEEQKYDFYCRFIENDCDFNDFKEFYFENNEWHKMLTSIDDIEEIIDWFNKNHFDYRCLIPKGLAIDATGLNIY